MADNLYSFYGGPQGKSFEIKRIFNSVALLANNNNTLSQDLLNGRNSQVGIGEFAFVSYGELTEKKELSQAYINSRDADLNIYQSTFNMTLWQKIHFSVYYNQNNTSVSGSFLEKLKTQAKKILYVEGNVVKELKILPDNNVINIPGGYGYILIGSTQGEIPLFSFVNEVGDKGIDVIDPNVKPSITIDNSDVFNPKINLKLPRAAQLAEEPVNTTTIDPKEEPTAQASTDNQGDLKFSFNLPRAARVDSVITTPIDPKQNPTVNITSETITGDLKFNFSLPGAAKFCFGNQVFYNGETVVIKNIPEEIQLGDYYINTDNSQIFYYEGEEEFIYKGSFFQDFYDTAYLIDTFSNIDNGEVHKVQISIDENTGKAIFNFPKPPEITVSAEALAPIDKNTSIYGQNIQTEKSYLNEDTINYHFQIPVQGAFSIHAVVDRTVLNGGIPFEEIPNDAADKYFEAEYNDLPADKVLLVHYLLTTGEELDYYYYRLGEGTNNWARSKITSQSTTGLVWGNFNEL